MLDPSDVDQGAGRGGRRLRLPAVVLLSFAVSAGLSTAVFAGVGGEANSFVGDDEDNSAIGGDGNDVMTGGEGDDFFQGFSGADSLQGDGDDDTLIGDPSWAAFADLLVGGDGNDQLAGFDGGDRLVGGPGNDVLGTIDFSRAGGPATVERGNDTLVGGTGNDVFLAGPGNDRIEARDGTADSVDCGEEENGAADTDLAIVDKVDTVVNCEKVKVPDTTPPDTRITDGPPKVVKTSQRKVEVSFTFKSTEKRSTFECKRDAGRYLPCTSPWAVTFAEGDHVWKVRARDKAGNVDRTPAVREFTVKVGRG